MSRRRLNDWIKSYLEYTSKLESPEVFHYWTGVGTIASVLRRNVFIDMGHFKWFPNFFIFFIGPPGVVRKSTSIDVGKKLVQEIKEISFGADVTTWQSFISALANSQISTAIGDATDIMSQEFQDSSALTIYSSELGNFLDPTNREQINALTDLWDAREDVFKKDTKTQGTDVIVNPCLNMIGCTTPAWIQDNFKGRFIGWGFSARCVMIYRDKKRHRIAYPGLEGKMLRERLKDSLVDDLREIARLKGKFTLSKNAISFGEEWYEHHCNIEEKMRLAGDLDQYRENFMARKQVHIHKLAMILSTSRSNELVITENDLKNAIEQVDKVESEMRSIFSSASVRENSVGERTIQLTLEYILKREKAKEASVVMLLVRSGATYREAQDTITMLMKIDTLRRFVLDDDAYLMINPEKRSQIELNGKGEEDNAEAD